jgi:histidinol-phosphate aminotransferase
MTDIHRPHPHLAGLEGYVPGEQPRGEGWVKLNTNEFPYPAAPEVIEAIHREAADSVRIYPDPTCIRLREILAGRHGVEPDRILIGNGSDEILRMLFHVYLGHGRPVAIVRPTYTLFEVLAGMFAVEVRTHPLEPDYERLPESLFQDDRDACFLPLPNPPFGSVFPDEDIDRLVATGRLVVLDGAYQDFSESADPIDRLSGHSNVVFTRSFSKSSGLAGLRVGYSIAAPEVILDLNRIRDSYNVNRVSQAAAQAALEAADYYGQCCKAIMASRRELAADLEELGFMVHRSHANLLFARHRHCRDIFKALKEQKILVRYFDQAGLEDGMRVTIGRPDENKVLVDALKKMDLQASSGGDGPQPLRLGGAGK